MDAEEVERRIAEEAGIVLNCVVDISHHQNRVDFYEARDDGLFGVIHKATQGDDYRDPEYKVREQKCRAVGMAWGAYHFGTGDVDGRTQADHFLSVTGTDRSTLRALDFEPDPHGPDMNISEAKRFVTRVFERTGVFPGFYGGYWHINDQLHGRTDDVLARCWFWLAKYSLKPAVPTTWLTWTLWQYTDGAAGPEPHSVPGIGRCDRDKFNGGLLGLKRLWGEV